MTSENDRRRTNESRSALMVGAIGLVGVVLGGAVTGIASVGGIRMQLDENNKETARKERVTAYTNFFYAANKVDNVFADLQQCVNAGARTGRSCTAQTDLARTYQRSLTGAFEILRVYATDRALNEADELRTLLESKQIPEGGPGDGDAEVASEKFPLQAYRDARDRFTLAMCNDLSPQPRDQCTTE
jgi:hypothetical protein